MIAKRTMPNFDQECKKALREAHAAHLADPDWFQRFAFDVLPDLVANDPLLAGIVATAVAQLKYQFEREPHGTKK